MSIHTLGFYLLVASLALSVAVPFQTAMAMATDAEDEPDEVEQVEDGSTVTDNTVSHRVPVADTDPALSQDKGAHSVYLPPKDKDRGQLLLFLPGTHGGGGSKRTFNQFAAQQGYHVITLAYKTDIALTAMKRSRDPGAFAKGRENLLFGTAPIGPFKVDHANSVLNRLTKLLTYLSAHYPKEGWGVYLKNGQPVWSKFVLAGSSQGAGHAIFLAQRYQVARVISFAGPKDFSLTFHSPGRWLFDPSRTPLNRIFCFTHCLDKGHGCTYPQQLQNYKALGLSSKYPVVDVENSEPPYSHTRLLTAHTSHGDPKHNHGVVVADPKYSAAWKYLLTEPCN